MKKYDLFVIDGGDFDEWLREKLVNCDVKFERVEEFDLTINFLPNGGVDCIELKREKKENKGE